MDAGKVYPYNIGWLKEHGIDRTHMLRFAFGRLPGDADSPSVKCRVPGRIIAVDGKTCLVEAKEDKACYLVDVMGLSEKRGGNK